MIKLKLFKKKLFSEKDSILGFVKNSILLKKPVNLSIVDSVVLNRVLKEDKYNQLLNSFDELLCDSSLIIFLYNLKYKKKNIGYNGAELFKNLVVDDTYNQLIIGATNSSFNQIKNKSLNKNLHYLDIGFQHNFIDFNFDLIESFVNNNNIQIVWVMLGNPKQDYVSNELKSRNNINCLIISSGATYLFYLEKIKSPNINLKGLKMFWVYRIIQNPQIQINRISNVLKSIPKFISIIEE